MAWEQITTYMLGMANLKLEENCDFSSNNNVWTWFYQFLAAILNFVWLFLLRQIFWQPF